jgi:hypothetical protein
MDVLGHLRTLLVPFLGALTMALSIVLARSAVGADVGESIRLSGGLVMASVVYIAVMQFMDPLLINKAITLCRQAFPVKRLEKS